MKTGFVFLVMFVFIVPLIYAGQMEATDLASGPYCMEDNGAKKLLITVVTAFGATAWTIILGINALLLGLIIFLGVKTRLKARKDRLTERPYNTTNP